MSSEVSEKQIHAEVERIAYALGKDPPSKVEIDFAIPMKRPRLEKNGEKLLLHGGWGLQDLRDQIVWTLLEPDLKNHENPFVRNPHRYDMILAVLVCAGFAALIITFPLVPFLLRILSIVVLLGSYLFATFHLGHYKKEYATIVGEAMLKTKNWPQARAEQFIKNANRMGLGLSVFLAVVLGVMGIALSIMFDIFDIPSIL
ncbi:MAG: hypothetical protein K9W43_07215 [Candidatus Thorarchaeota archaeon]|nr:hypothetical protein [Candidatus Thorarchaeota archaeon]